MIQSHDWIKAAIESCTNEFHLDGCHQLLDLFSRKYGEEGKELHSSLYEALLEKKVHISINL